MAKELENKEEKKAVKSERAKRWEAYVAAYAEHNPTKYAAKKARGEFDTIPDLFV